jgi:hypothetical protein
MPRPVRFEIVDYETIALGVDWFACVRRTEGTVSGVMQAGAGKL